MKFHTIYLLLATLGTSAALNSTIFDLLHSVNEIAKGIIASEPGAPSPDNVFKSIENIVVGLPLQIASSIANSICSAVISQGRAKTPEKYAPVLGDIKFQLRTACDKRSYSLVNANDLAADESFDPAKPTVIFATGWTTTVNGSQQERLAKAYNCRGDVNYIALDFGDYMKTLYPWSAQNTDVIGKYVAEALLRLASLINIADLHLIGHSLGAQIMSSAARHYRVLTNESLPYVTGLDPALPCFNNDETLTTLSASDADFVDIIHTDPGVLGQSKATGSVDFFVGGHSALQAGCFSVTCSHSRAVSYYAESVYPNNEDNFLAKRCDSLRNLQAGKCRGKAYPMGYAVPHDLRGTYVLEVNDKSPYGKNADVSSMDPETTTCGSCEA
ncbi:vitellogenin-1-like [Bactrocera neohumeralis]|uniref:vitellogenin-1-like n=1 Tax=Bactrocera neohumeralis TaxID=98809 RepID=UPI0021668C09|nr:vitellogenin-1-like [Bactrocera neohumeralis]